MAALTFCAHPRGKEIRTRNKPLFSRLWAWLHGGGGQEAARAALGEAKLRAMFEISSVGMVEANPADRRLRRVNHAFCRLTGYDHAELIGKTVDELNHPDDREGDRARYEKLLAGEVAEYTSEKRYVRKDGSVIWVLATVNIIRDDQGTPTLAFGLVQDVSHRRQATEQLRAAYETSRHLVENSPFGVYVVDADFRLVQVSAGAQKVFSTVRPLLGRDFAEVLRILWPEPFATEAIGRFQHTLQTGEPYRSPSMVERRQDIDQTEAYDWKIERITLPDGRYGVVCHFYDLSDRNRLEAAVRDSEQALREADRKKNEFLATLAHELRNPLAPVMNSLEILKRAGTDPAMIEQSRTIIERQVQHMSRLIEDLLDISRITQGKIQLRLNRVELKDVLVAARDNCSPLASQQQQDLSMELPPQPMWLDADPVRLTQIFQNLINNACKYTPPKRKIWVRARREEGQVLVSVKDGGIGIPKDKLKEVFAMFSQVDSSMVRAAGGLGIGLTLVQRLVELHGGSVSAHSDGPGTGAEFVVRLPLPQTADAETPAMQAPPAVKQPAQQASRRVLVVDDNADSAASLARLLTLTGNETHVAHDGLEAIDKAAGVYPDVVLLDIGLPRMNGYDVCREIRKTLAERRGPKPLMIALTGYDQEADRLRSREAGFDHHMVKPLDYEMLTSLLQGHFVSGDGADGHIHA